MSGRKAEKAQEESEAWFRAERKRMEIERERLLAQIEQDRQRAEKITSDFQRERNILEAILENTRIQIAYFDAQFNFVKVNSMYALGSGYSKEELIGRNHFELFPNPENQKIFESVRETGQPVEFHARPFEYRYQPWRGVTYWDWTLMPVKDKTGKVQGLVLSLQEVTKEVHAEDARRKAYEELEKRVEERTAELVKANEALKDEIREHAKAEEERLLLANYMGRLLESTDEGIFGIDLQGRCTFINRVGAEMVGYEPDEIIGKNIHGIVHHSRADGSPYPDEECLAYSALRTRRGVRVENEVFWRKDGTSFPVEYSSMPILEDEEVKGAVVVFTNISERKRVEEERRQLMAEAQHRSMELGATIAAIADGVITYGPTGEIVRMNPAAERMLGYSPERLELPIEERLRLLRIETPEGEPLPIKDLPAVRALRGETVHGVILIIHPPSDGKIWVSVSAAPISTADSGLLGAVVVFTDITELHELTEVAQRRAAELQGILDNMLDSVMVCDAHGQITLANKSSLQLTGMTTLEDIKRPLAECPALLQLRHLDGRPVTSEELPLARALAGETVVQEALILYNRRIERDIYIRTNASPIRNKMRAVAGAVEVCRDVTELTELDRLKDQFISVAAHELKTPVTGVKGFAQILLRREHEGVTPRGLKILEAIDRQANQISQLVNDLLDISRLQKGQLELAVERVDLLWLVKRVIDRMALTTTKHRIRLIGAEPATVKGDADRLEEVLVNLIDNAIKFSPQGGNIDVSIAVGKREATVSVRDYGVGIPQDRQARIFQRFYRAHTGTPYDYGGLGVGLFISKEIITRHGGSMWFESEEGKGSTFLFALPLAKPDSEEKHH